MRAARRSQSGAALRKVILDHPLPERLVHDEAGVAVAQGRGKGGSTSAGVVAGVIRSTIVAGKRTVSAIHCARSGSRARAKASTMPRTSAPFDGRLSQLSTVKGGVPSARRRARPATTKPGGRGRCVGVGKVVGDVGMIEGELARRRVVAIALLGHGQRHDPHRRVGHGGHHRAGIFRGDQHAPPPRRSTRGLSPSGPSSTAVKVPPCGPSWSRAVGLRRLTARMPQSPPRAAIASSVKTATKARKKAPGPRWTIADLRRRTLALQPIAQASLQSTFSTAPVT